jgi:hypothetical protein
MKTTAQQQFVANIEAIKDQLSELQNAVHDFLYVDPDYVNWDNVGDTAEVKRRIGDLILSLTDAKKQYPTEARPSVPTR